jgi:hypothetical protein
MLFLQIRKGIIHLKENQTEKKMTTVNMTSKKVQLCLLKLADYKLCASFDQPKNDDQYHSQTQDVECAICFKNICNKVFVCSEPCNKTFHPACLEKMVDQLEETAWEEEKKPDYRCCYCRREFDLRFYQNEIFGRYLLGLKAGGYDVSDAMQQLCKKLEAAGTSAAGTSAAGTSAAGTSAAASAAGTSAAASAASAAGTSAASSEAGTSEADSDEEDPEEFQIYLPLDKTYIKKPKQANRAVLKSKKTHQVKVKQYCARR